MRRRAGVTLLEVLVAIFVMGIGLLALLTLFPIGALRMAEAIRDRRCGEAAVMANACAIAVDVRNDAFVIDPGGTFNYYNNAWPENGGALPNAQPYDPSYPVLIDPIGYRASPIGVAQDWVGATPGVLRRRPVAYAPTTTGIYNWFSLTDDLVFDSATPGLAAKAGANVLRDTRFSWAYLCQRPYAGDPAVVDLSVVVFNKRPLGLTQDLNLSEYVYPNRAYFDTASNLVTVDYTSNVPPPVRPGDWILDVTVLATSGIPRRVPHAYFYRVVGVNEFADASGNTYAQYEVQTPLRGWDNNAAAAGPYGYPGTIIVLEGVAEVFEKGPCRLP